MNKWIKLAAVSLSGIVISFGVLGGINLFDQTRNYNGYTTQPQSQSSNGMNAQGTMSSQNSMNMQGSGSMSPQDGMNMQGNGSMSPQGGMGMGMGMGNMMGGM